MPVCTQSHSYGLVNPLLHKSEKDFPLCPDTVDLPMKSQRQVTCQPKHVCIIMWQDNALQSLFVHNVILHGRCCLRHLEPGITYSLGGCDACMGFMYKTYKVYMYSFWLYSTLWPNITFNDVTCIPSGLWQQRHSNCSGQSRPWPDQYFHLMWVCLNVSECLVGVVRMFNIAYGYSCIVWPPFSFPTITDSILHSPHQSAPH